MPSEIGDTALVLLVPEAESIVGNWRDHHDPAAAEGMPAHITVLYPFIPADQIDARVLRDIESIASEQHLIALEFSEFGEFPGVLWLDPASDDCRRLVQTVRRQWPKLAPYGNPQLEVIPHLTVTDGAGATVTGQARKDIGQRLPFSTLVESLALMSFDGNQWVLEREFTFRRQAV